MSDATGPGESASAPVRLELPPDSRAPAQARHAARDVLLRWRLPHLVDAVVLAASELVTNAVRHGRPPVSIGLQRRAQQVRLEIHDGNPTEPPLVPDEGDVHSESGRGIGIVQALADDVAVEQVTGDGKIIQVTFGADPRGDDLR